MEGGNKSSIDLEAGLDIKSSDMLVPLSNVKFQHNWQKYQGKCLPNSLRFEKNGWAAGWNVFNFEYNINRVQVNGKWFSSSLINNNPTYKLSMYETKDSNKVIASKFYSTNSKLLNDVGARLVDSTHIAGTVGDRNFTIIWNPETETASLSSVDVGLSIETNVNSDKSLNFKVSNTSAAININNNVYLPAELTGTGLYPAQKYNRFEAGVHYWGNNTFTYNGNKVHFKDVSTTPTISDNNKITFSLSYPTTVDLNLYLTLTEYYFDFYNFKAENNSGDTLLQQDAAKEFAFNKYDIDYDKNAKLEAGKDGIVIKMQVPVWFSVSFKPQVEEAGAKWANNVSEGNIGVKLYFLTDEDKIDNKLKNELPSYKIKYKLTSFLDNKEVVIDKRDSANMDDIKARDNIDYISSDDLKYRFNEIKADNSLVIPDKFNTQKYLINTELHVSSFLQFSDLSSSKVDKLFGGLYTLGSGVFNANEYFAENKWADKEDLDNAVYKEKDISEARSIKCVGDDDEFDTSISDLQFVADNIPGNDTLCKKYVAVLNNNSPAIYSASDEGKENIALYDATGKYIGGTYEACTPDYGNGSNFWPFKYVPKFNHVNKVDPDDESTFIVTKGVYYIKEDGSFVTNLDDFKKIIMGTYNAAIDADNYVLVTNPAYNINREVYRFLSSFDFDSSAWFVDDETTAKYGQLWEKLYPDAELSITVAKDGNSYNSSDKTYLDYKNIIVRKVGIFAQDEKYTSKPGVVIWTEDNLEISLPAFNEKEIVIPKNSKITLKPKICHNNIDATGNYNTDYDIDNGYFDLKSIATTKDEEERKYSLPSYFGIKQSVNVTKVEKDDKEYTISSKSCQVYPCTVKFYATPKSGVICWADEIGITAGTTSVSSVATFYKKDADGNIIYEGEQGGGKHPMIDREYNYKLKSNLKSVGVYTSKYSYPSSNPVYYLCSDKDDGVVLSQPIWGNVAFILKYTEVVEKNELIANAKKYLKFEPLPDASCNSNDLMVDRSSSGGNVNPNSYKWFSVELSSVGLMGDDKFDGQFTITLTTLNDKDGVFYAKKQSEGSDKDSLKEVIRDYYYPAIAGKNGYMNMITGQVITCYLKFKATTTTLPLSGSISIGSIDSSIPHKFCNEGKNELQNSTTFTPDNFKNVDTLGNLKCVLSVNGTSINLNWASKIKTLSYTGAQKNISILNADIVFKPFVAVLSGNNIALSTTVNLNFTNITGRFAKSSPDTLQEYKDNVFTLSNNGYTYKYNSQSFKIYNSDAKPSIVANDTWHNIKLALVNSVTIVAVMTSVKDGKVSIYYGGQTYRVPIATFLNNSDAVKVLSTDIRRPSKTDVIGKIIPGNEYQLIRQQWNTTVEVENFWWVDDTHVLELNQYNFVLKRKTDDLDDWNGDRFEKIYEITRFDILSSDVYKYFVTNMYNTSKSALLCTLKAKSTYSIEMCIYDIRQNLKLIKQLYLQINSVSIGNTLNVTTVLSSNSAQFNTYAKLTAGQLLSQADWSNTMVGNKLIIGCHMSKNFDQWAVVFDIDNNFNCIKCIQGYGYVGLQGQLTGGMIPVDYFDKNKGFNDKVQDLSVLSKVADDNADLNSNYKIKNLDELYKMEAKVVGTAERQWYLKLELQDIVSHLIWTGSDYNVEVLPLTNNYAVKYDSPSFFTEVMADLCIEFFAFKEAFKFPSAMEVIWTTFMVACAWPLIYMYNPRYGKFAYLQQTIGQYAYVHYNSSESLIRPEASNNANENGLEDKPVEQAAPVLSDEYTFDKQIIEQSASVGSDWLDFAQILFAAFAPALDIVEKDIKVNSDLNQTSMFDTGKKYTQAALENLKSLAASSIMTQSSDSGLNSSVVGIKSLDMFYSTSDKQEINAGPGFVEHNFVADCVAQSSTSVHVEGAVQQVSFTIKALTMYQGLLAQKLLEFTATALERAGDMLAQQMVCGTSLAAAGAALVAAAYVMRAANEVVTMAYAQLGEVLDAFTQRGVTSERTGAVSRHSLSNEGKHKYGEKNETFMWPCFGIPSERLDYTDEKVVAGIEQSDWALTLCPAKYYYGDAQIGLFSVVKRGIEKGENIEFSSMQATGKHYESVTFNLNGKVPFYQAACYGESTVRKLPADMACIQGVPLFLPTQAFKNENISVSNPAFSPSLFQDYVIDKTWQLAQCCTYGMQQWVTVKDTKITNCPPSNMRVTQDFCGIATSYSAIEVKQGLSKVYMRPWAITPNTLAFNCTGYNTILDNKLYHSFDGISYRIVEWTGTAGSMNKNSQTYLYSFQINDRFKRSNKLPANEVLGCFSSEPTQAIESIDKLWTLVTVASKQKGLVAGTVGEDKDAIRWALPIFTEPVTTLPAAVKTLTAMPLAVIDGITCLVTDLYNNQTAYKAPLSVDFTIGKNVYRQTEEYICSIKTVNGVDVTEDLVPTLGLKYIGATPSVAYFYSKATRCYYMFSGSTLTKMDMMERFRDIKGGYWDFVNQEVVMPCLMTFKRLNPEVLDKDTETDNIIVPVLSNSQVSGELPPPITTLFNDRSWYKVISLPSGLAYQGPNRVIINRSVFIEYMLESLKSNVGKWKRMNKESYVTKRVYSETYDNILNDVQGVDGWTYNPFVLVTSPLGLSEDTDCLYEWVITFCWPIEMDLIYGVDNFAVVNITAETMTPGGKVKSRPTHIYLQKELFTRNGNYGYYSFRYQSRNGAGNRERLHIWSDQYIAISSIDCEYKVITKRRTEILTQQLDVQNLKEL